MPANPRTKPNPKDHTGNQKRILAEQHAEDVAKRRGEISMQHAEAAASLDQPVSLDEKGRTLQSIPEEIPQDGPIELPPEKVRIRIACDLEKVTIGQGTAFEFKEGQVYELPLNVALHLDRLGYVWQWL